MNPFVLLMAVFLVGCGEQSSPRVWMGSFEEVGVNTLYEKLPDNESRLRYVCLTPPVFVHSFGSSTTCSDCDFTFGDTSFYVGSKEYQAPEGVKVLVIDYDHSIIPVQLSDTELNELSYPRIMKITESEVWRTKLRAIVTECRARRDRKERQRLEQSVE